MSKEANIRRAAPLLLDLVRKDRERAGTRPPTGTSPVSSVVGERGEYDKAVGE